MAKNSYGVLLTAYAALTAGTYQWSQQYCANKSPSNCYGIVEHKKSVSYRTSHSGTDKVNGGHFTLKTDDVSTLGQSSYDVDVTAQGGSNTPGQDGAWVNPANLGWSDNLHIKSKTLPKGTPVTISVQLSIQPSVTNVSCTSDENSQGSIDYIGTGFDQFGYTMEVGGGCVGSGSFGYFVSGGRGGQGTTDTGVISAAVGDTAAIAGSGYVKALACMFNSTCDGSYVTDLVGKVTWKITKISPAGVTYTTDSGLKYN